ncbi:MAG: hypothetical protein QXI16_00450 [Sulfolobaceae archaeon]
MQEVTVFNLLEIATSDNTIAELGFINAKLVDILDILQARYLDELFDTIAIQILDNEGNEVYYCDSMNEEGYLDSLKLLEVKEIVLDDDWYSDYTDKKGYRITLNDKS